MNIPLVISTVLTAVIVIVFFTTGFFRDQMARERLLFYNKINKVVSQPKEKQFAWRGLLISTQPPTFFYKIIPVDLWKRMGNKLQYREVLSIWWNVTLVSGMVLVGYILYVSWGIRGVWILCFWMCSIFFAPSVYIRNHIKKKNRAVTKGLPDFLDLLTLTVEAGLNLEQALNRTSRSFPGFLGKELRLVMSKIQYGVSHMEALAEFAERFPSEDVSNFIRSLHVSERLGTSLARTLRVQSELIRVRKRQRAKELAQTAPIRMVPALVFCFLPALLLIYLSPPILLFFVH